MTPTPIELLGAPVSPYTRKMLAYLRFRGIPYRLNINLPNGLPDYPKANPPLFPTFYLPDENGTVQAVTDSTPLIRRFEQEFSGRETLPSDPVTRFLHDIVEDYADEWVTKFMFHYRWGIAENARQIAPMLVYWLAPQAPSAMANAQGKEFGERQIGRLGVIGSNDTTKALIEEGYVQFLTLLDAEIQKRPFLFGNRPSAADFAMSGQLSQLTSIDPAAMQVAHDTAPRLRAWLDHAEDATGYPVGEDGWLSRNEAAKSLHPLLTEIGQTYAPFAQANAEALAAGNSEVSAKIKGKTWVQPAFSYQGKCLRVLRESFASLSQDDQTTVRELLTGTGCEVFCAPA